MKLPTFTNALLFEQAFTHRSYLNEAKQQIESNERLEFLGDSILSFVVSEALYKNYPQFHEGTLTNIRSMLVNTKMLAQIAKELDFGKYLKLSRGEEEAKGRENQSLLADSFEAFIGALFLDQGIAVAKEFITSSVLPHLEQIIKKQNFKDPKSLFQEQMQAKNHASPVYKVLVEEGPSHAKVFTVGVFVKDRELGIGKGKSKQEAEEQAAKQALENIQEK